MMQLVSINIKDLSEFGILKNVEYLYEYFYDDNKNFLSSSLKSIFLEFENDIHITISISELDDTIQILRNKIFENIDCDDNSDYRIMTPHNIWLKAINKGVIWVWELKNNQGYIDSIQIEFKDTIIQIMCIASSLKIFRVDQVLN